MTDEKIKKLVIKSGEFPNLQFEQVYNPELERYEIGELFYSLRYRVISEDKNRYSHWSPITRLVMPDVTTPFAYNNPDRINVSVSGNPAVIVAIWNHPGENEPETDYEKIFNKIDTFDVWIRWNNNNTTDLEDEGWEDWQYRSKVSTNTFNIIKKDTNVKRLDIAIQVPTGVKIRDYYDNKLTLYRAISPTLP